MKANIFMLLIAAVVNLLAWFWTPYMYDLYAGSSWTSWLNRVLSKETYQILCAISGALTGAGLLGRIALDRMTRARSKQFLK